ncbi:MAG: right-handed parallel beta-helix repeat-containing protein, partial [Rhodothermales bacterium]|nr:right-handed parallel beta-helix repeat-containing protein [Rhodothermales bacterium]
MNRTDGFSAIQGNFIVRNKVGIRLYRVEDLIVSQNVGTANGTFIKASDNSQYGFFNNNVTESTESQTGINTSSSEAVIVGNIIADNAGDGVVVDSASVVTLADNSITGNLAFGVSNNDPASVVFAQGNWWGDPSGPGGSGSGGGDEVSSNVDFANWSDQAPSLVLSVGRDTVYVSPGEQDTVLAFVQNWLAPSDVVSFTVTDTEGWLSNAGTSLENLDVDLGAARSVGVTVPGSAAPASSSVVSIEATSQSDPTAVRVDSFVVMAYMPTLTEIVITPDTLSIEIGDSRMFVATGR